MKTFKCPKCGHIQKALAKYTSHQCPANHNRVTQYEEVKDDD